MPTQEENRITARQEFDRALAIRQSGAPDNVETRLRIGHHLSNMWTCLNRFSGSTLENIGLTQEEVDEVDGLAILTYCRHCVAFSNFQSMEALIEEIRRQVERWGITDTECLEVGCGEDNLDQMMETAAISEAKRIILEAVNFRARNIIPRSLPFIERALEIVSTHVRGGFSAAFGVEYEDFMTLFRLQYPEEFPEPPEP